MKKKRTRHSLNHIGMPNFLLKMKLLTFFIFVSVASVTANSYSQQTKFNMSFENVTVRQIFQEIEDNSEFILLYSEKSVDVNRTVNVRVKNQTVEKILDQVFSGIPNYYEIHDRQIAIMEKGAKELPIIMQKVSEAEQQKSVSGKVTDTSGAPLPGVTVVIKGTTHGNITDADGNYSILNVPSKAIIVFSFVGMKTQEIPLLGKSTINVVLTEEAIGIDEVVAVGYGVQKKKLITGATSQVSGKDIQKQNSSDVLGAMQSQVPGLSVTQNSGQPGEEFKVTVRGLGTIGDAAPLYVIDGVAGGNINALNPNDIESIDVLKDAASAAIYGARAANGVILITTKQGVKGKLVFSYDSYIGIQNVVNLPKMLNAKQYMDVVNKARVAWGNEAYDWAIEFPAQYTSIIKGEWNGTNWVEESTNKNAPVQNHSFNVSGGTDQSRLSLGFSYLTQEGTIGKPINPDYTRYTTRINSDHTLISSKGNDILKIGENVIWTHSSKSGIRIGGIYDNDIRNLIVASPLMPVNNSDGGYYILGDMKKEGAQQTTLRNPIAKMVYDQGNNLRLENILQANFYLEFSPLKNLKYRSSYGYKYNQSAYRRYVPAYVLSDTDNNVTDDVTQSQSYANNWTFENVITYSFSVQKHAFNLMVGQSLEKWGMGESLSATNSNSLFPGSFDHAYIDNTQGLSVANTSISGQPWDQGRLSSFFGRINYDYRETYLATIVMRGDGSSNFAKENRWGYFPSVSAGWVLTNEQFAEPLANVLDFFKLRASWGQNGNSSIDNFQYLATISFDRESEYFFNDDKSNPSTGAYPDILPNKNIKWETSEQRDIGFDARVLDSRLGISFDWYKKSTKDWLVRAPALASFGTGAPYINGGDIVNRGYEISLDFRGQKREFSYNLGLNWAFNHNEITRIANNEGIIHGEDDVLSENTDELYRAQVGFPIGYFWGYETSGIFQNQAEIDAVVNANKNNKGNGILQKDPQPGDVIFVDQNGDGIINEDDKTMIGDPNPDYILGFNLSMTYKGWDLSLNAKGAFGNQIAKSYRSFADKELDNYTTDILNCWNGEGTSNKLPRLVDGKHQNWSEISDIWIENGDYIKITNVQLGYDFNKLLKQRFLQQCRLYVSVQNLYTFTNYSGMDPEIGYGSDANWASGIDVGFYPAPRTFMMGLNLKF